MLISLHIENFALVDCLDLEFPAGLNVLTGETGAGKSIILDALDLALGGKVSGRSLRTGASKGRIDATFSLTPELQKWLQTNQLDGTNDTLVCSRELTAGKLTAGKGSVRNRSRINGIQVNKQQLESLRDRLVEITAQGQTVQLGQANVQRNWLDGLGGGNLIRCKVAVAQAYEACQKAKQILEKRRQREQQRQEQLDLFEFQAKELREAQLDDPNELDQLEQDRSRLSHAVELKQQSYEVYQALYQNDAGGDACADLLGRAQQTLEEMVTYDEQIQPILELVTGALAQVEEAGRAVNAYGNDLETDPEQLQNIEARIMQLKQICRKYGPTLAEAIAYDQQLQGELDELSDGGQSLAELEQNYAAKQQVLAEQCAMLTGLRQKVAKKLETALVKELKPLAMDKVKFEVDISPMTPTAVGSDRITFMFSPNPGEPLQPLTQVASGGEMSRFLLALKVCLAQTGDAAPEYGATMVFDEIDAGVSGRVTQAIAEKLYQLGAQPQVLCVTHQPLVAAMADAHFHVNKTVIQEISEITTTATERTVVRVSPLAGEQRKQELAQLAGGKSDDDAIAFAESLLTQAADVRSKLSKTNRTRGKKLVKS
ncbi:MAG: DNA repair protein RecN [Cyanothece sp. SIO2G6]|nr:DNA repair protein RecN [Cyanothece sp. SIO2G6]